MARRTRRSVVRGENCGLAARIRTRTSIARPRGAGRTSRRWAPMSRPTGPWRTRLGGASAVRRGGPEGLGISPQVLRGLTGQQRPGSAQLGDSRARQGDRARCPQPVAAAEAAAGAGTGRARGADHRRCASGDNAGRGGGAEHHRRGRCGGPSRPGVGRAMLLADGQSQLPQGAGRGVEPSPACCSDRKALPSSCSSRSGAGGVSPIAAGKALRPEGALVAACARDLAVAAGTSWVGSSASTVNCGPSGSSFSLRSHATNSAQRDTDSSVVSVPNWTISQAPPSSRRGSSCRTHGR